jgi:alkylation response protein AidB-like acyl-CoA dehydrogenase
MDYVLRILSFPEGRMRSALLIDSPQEAHLKELCGELARRADALDASGNWPTEQLQMCGKRGVFAWFVPQAWGGMGWSDQDIVRGYLQLSEACLTTTFIITQRTGACRRILASENEPLKARLLPDLLNGRSFATVGISHLTTSRRHLAAPAMAAHESGDGFVLEGFSPWVTGAVHADTIVTGKSWSLCRRTCPAWRPQCRLACWAYRPATRAKCAATTYTLTANGCWPGRSKM